MRILCTLSICLGCSLQAGAQVNDIHIAGGTIHVSVDGKLPVAAGEIEKWITHAATAVSQYDGKFPVQSVRLEINCRDDGAGVGSGVEYDGRLIRIRLGHDTKPADLEDDWELTHEMFHLSFPDLDERYHWMEEGMADYLEPIARARIGRLTPEQVWMGYVRGMPKGQPKAGDKGLDNTATWGRTYWGGCMFWLLADVRIREQTQNAKSVDDVFRAILKAGGDDRIAWALDRVIDVGDKATGTTVLKDLHDEMGEKPVKVDLDGLWKRLGIEDRGRTIVFDDKAPLAEIRKSMTTTRPSK